MEKHQKNILHKGRHLTFDNVICYSAFQNTKTSKNMGFSGLMSKLECKFGTDYDMLTYEL